MSNDTVTYGGYQICPQCEKVFYVINPDIWVYKRYATMKKGGNSKMLYFCSWHCKRAFDKEYDASKKKSDGRTRKPIKIDDLRTADTKCGECRYCMQIKYGFHDCTIYGRSTNPHKPACLRYRPLQEPLQNQTVRAKSSQVAKDKMSKRKKDGGT